MSLNFINTKIDGLFIIEPQIFCDERGYFFEAYNQHEFLARGLDINYVQDNQSLSKKGVIRGLHCQLGEHSQGKLVRVLQGSIIDVVVDIRKHSPTFGQSLQVELSSDNQRSLLIPKNFLHGFAVVSETAIVCYKCDAFYCGSAEFTVRYDDPELNIKWPFTPDESLISKKDLAGSSFSKLKSIIC